MKLLIRSLIIVYVTAAQAVAQHALVGTWEMISAAGKDADGQPFFLDTTSVRETKIITPTHYMLIAWDVENDSLIFNRTMAGEVSLQGEKYIEIPTQASVQIFDNVSADFTWKLDGDIFTQSGSIIRPDGKKVILDALIFRRVSGVNPSNSGSISGTWTQVSGQYRSRGANITSFSRPDAGLLIATPTHWMRMNHKKDKFDGVMYGTYSRKND